MDYETMKAAIEAQFCIGHFVPSPYWEGKIPTHTNWSWPVDAVRQQLHVPANTLWDERIMALVSQGQATYALSFGEPWTYDEAGNMVTIPNWRDTVPFEEWAEIAIYARGVLWLATLYGRPYVNWRNRPHGSPTGSSCMARARRGCTPHATRRSGHASIPKRPPSGDRKSVV